MIFTTIEFVLFFSIFFLLYWFIINKNLKHQNILILVASYIFYGWWDWKFLILIFVSSLVDFLVGLYLMHTEDPLKRRLLLYASLLTNLGILGFFKYFNFFIESLQASFSFFNSDLHFSTLDIILPVGISFYTLQTLSYTIDVYDRKMDATKDYVSFFAYVSFFPQLVAGPIERANKLLPQFSKKRVFNYAQASDGMRQILWGVFKKMVVADNCSIYIGKVFSDYNDYNGSTLLFALFLKSIQIYCDFSGYSDIAIGTARILGFNLSKNFDYPFFSRNVSEFWQKWHISLISWFRDYIVHRLKAFSKIKVLRNVFIIFIITGLWHGAKWTYIVWGIFHAFTFIPLIYGKRKKYRKVVAKGRVFPSWIEAYQMSRTFIIFILIGVFFVSDTVVDGFIYLSKIFSLSFFNLPEIPNKEVLLAIPVLFIIEWVQRGKEHGLDFDATKLPALYRWSIYATFIILILFFGGTTKDFIYFQF